MNLQPVESVETTLLVQWPLPLWITLVLVAMVGSLVAWLYLHERGNASRGWRLGLAALRGIALALVLWMMSGWSWHRNRIQRPDLVIAVDVSDSMRTADGSADQTGRPALTRLKRTEELLSLSKGQLAQLQQQYHVRSFAVADTAVVSELDLSTGHWSDSSPSSPMMKATNHSRLGDALCQIIDQQAGRGTAAILFLSDGIATAGVTLSEAGRRARLAGLPIHAVAVGQQHVRPDLRIGDLLADQQVYLGDQVTLEASVFADDITETSALVQLTDLASGNILDQQRVQLTDAVSQQSVRLSFVPDRAGEIAVRVQVQALPNELDTLNNRVEHRLLVNDRVIRVLMVFAEPSYEFRFLKHFLERSTLLGAAATKAFELTSVLQAADLEYIQQDSSAERFVPSDPAALAQFDAFVFGSMNSNAIPRSTQQAIVQSIIEGGAGCIFLLSDQRAFQSLNDWPLKMLLPTQTLANLETNSSTTQYQLSAQPSGRSSWSLPAVVLADQSHWQLDMLPRLQSLLHIESLKPGAQVLAEVRPTDGGQLRPLLVAQFAGAGRSALLATDETYRWTGAFGSDRFHQQFWGQTLRWLCRGKLATLNPSELKALPVQAPVGSPISFQLRLPSTRAGVAETAELSITRADGYQRSILLANLPAHPGQFQGTVEKLEPGSYCGILVQPALAEPLSVDFSVTAPPGELAQLRTDFLAMQEMADLSGGCAYRDDSGHLWPSHLPPGNSTVVGSLPPLPIWNQPVVTLLLLFILTAEWLLRRRMNML
ncbi:MAG: hypothetical protein KF752_05405 [Pirellulaceae bacterium]|nr:hypothetical protein [Pirellulaceae bacterium]